MSDVNVTVELVDRGMDIMENYEREIEDLRAHVAFDITTLIDMVELEKQMAEQELIPAYSESPSDDGASFMADKAERLGQLLSVTSARGEELNCEWEKLCALSVEHAVSAKRSMGEYIRKLNLGMPGAGAMDIPLQTGDPEYRVVIVDSCRYPETAEHIRLAQNMGFPEYVTLSRAGAADRRKASLAGVDTSDIYDRDEWPMACFEEGGAGANVVHVDRLDNRGAGSAVGWQMRRFPDGSRVRVRVI